MVLCKICDKKINLFSRIFAKKCSDCDALIHRKCSLSILDFDSYTKGTIAHIEPLCDSCVKQRSAKFGDKKYCETCGYDFTRSSNLTKCDSCKIIGHDACFEIFANRIDVKWLYPYIYPNKDHSYFCAKCSRSLEEKMHKAQYRAEHEWIGGIRSSHMGGHRIVKTIGKVELNETSLCKEPAEVYEYLKIRAIQLGANAYVNSFWKRETYRHEERYLKGYSKNGNPYYGTRYSIEEWFVGHADAVIVEPNRYERSIHNKKFRPNN